MAKNFCVLTAVLEASATLGRPLPARGVIALVNRLRAHPDGFSCDQLKDLYRWFAKSLRIAALCDDVASMTIMPGTPLIVFSYTSDDDDEETVSAHAQFGFAPIHTPTGGYISMIIFEGVAADAPKVEGE